MAGCGPTGEWLLVAATVASIQLAQGQTADQISILSSFFGVMGNNLGLLASIRFAEEDKQTEKDPCKDPKDEVKSEKKSEKKEETDP